MVDEVGLKVNRAFSARALWISHFLGRCPRGLKKRHWRSAETGLKAGVNEMMKAVRNGFVTAECAIHRLKAGVSETGSDPSRLARVQPLNGEARDFARVFQIKFVFDMRAVGFHRLGAEMQQLGDLTDFLAFADQFQNFKFAIAQSLDSVGLAFSLAMCELCDYLRRHGRAEIRPSIKNFPNRVDYIGHRFVLHDVTIRSRTQRA